MTTLAIRTQQPLRDFFAVLGATIALGLIGPLAIPLPFSPVPISLTAQVILLLAVVLGSKRASLAVLGYLIQGLAGLPVFSMGRCGLLHLAGPTGGYLVGFLVAAYVTGRIVERMGSGSHFKAMLIGNLVLYPFGLLQLSQFIGLQQAFLVGCLPFLAGDLLKLVLAAKTSQTLSARGSALNS